MSSPSSSSNDLVFSANELPKPQSSKQKVALITGVTGQDGSYLSELLLSKGYIVYGIIRRSSSFNTGRVEHIYKDPHVKSNFRLLYGDLTDTSNLISIMAKVRPDEVYNLAAQSHVKVSFEMPEYTADVDGLGTLRLLEAIRSTGLTEVTKFYQASTSELYGLVQEKIQKETTPFYPRSPYGCAKLYSYWIVKNYREAYNMFALNEHLILNLCIFCFIPTHESPRRGETFVTRKITMSVARIKKGLQKCLFLGNLDAQRDWGHARDYVEGMWRMLQQEKADDYVLSTGEVHSVREFCEESFKHVGMEIEWKGEKGTVKEVAVLKGTDQVVIHIDPAYFRPTEVEFLLGDSSKAKKELGWEKTMSFKELVKDMIDSDMDLLEKKKNAHLLNVNQHQPEVFDLNKV